MYRFSQLTSFFTHFRFDGIDYRIFYEVGKRWNIKWNIFVPTPSSTDSIISMVQDLANGVADLSLCRFSLILEQYTQMDMGIAYENHNVKFLVPVPTLIDDAAAIDKSLTAPLWAAFICSLILLGILLTILQKFHENPNKRKPNCAWFESVFYLISIATRHSIKYLPTQMPIRYILLSWMLVSLAIRTGYSMSYLSMLTSPKFSDPVDAVEQFVEKGLLEGHLID